MSTFWEGIVSKTRVLHWFRQDLRLSDNPALKAAQRIGPVIPAYILEDGEAGEWTMGGASRWWLHHSLMSLNASVGGKLVFGKGSAAALLVAWVQEKGITHVTWNRCYEPWRIERDKRIKARLQSLGVQVLTENGSLLWEPWEIAKSDGTPYKVFSAYYKRGCLTHFTPPRPPQSTPRQPEWEKPRLGVRLEDLALLPSLPWDAPLAKTWSIGEGAAKQQLKRFLKHGLSNYQVGRDRPADTAVSRLSPHLHFGEISPHTVWAAAKAEGQNTNTTTFLSELGWREFSHYVLYHWPTLPTQPAQAKFAAFPWKRRPAALKAWQQGQTGIPIVDAGMRELWQTGYMHNRVRMIVASFLVKNLQIHWRDGARWFWDCLVDADLANNSASWQWVAGCGFDAAPYFRIFNPVTQAQKFDPDGEYIRQWVPELTKVPNRYLAAPWEAPDAVLNTAGVKLGAEYPQPIVDLAVSRQDALAAFASLKTSD